ncbi:S1C family serine protease [Streptomyces iranensis]|uniref:Peptidase S1 and S6 chymotrypsin/Hap n=1 Tax=Streptomyces iranensis TaxID=576784 RepID=A0A060ZQ11_9ACTN|nr:trypsin-like peptidase domain-containing protein [Streptomyces iranensis]MBP2067991.1 putative serine protease PepD [Streptomyces iranensis]CDR07951.1 peptidase S1 and S6 chymotrypsin/Hap [Streptomyces iranensis]
MTDSTRRSGADEPYPYAYGGGAGYPDPPGYQPQQPVTTPSGVTVWPGDGSGSGSGGSGSGAGEDGGAFASEGAHGGGGRRRARASRPVALIAAVAAVSALVGGGAAALVTHATQKADTTISTPVVNAKSSSNSGVSAVAAAVSPSIVEVSASGTSGQSTGSGVVITSGGEIITNNHVVSSADAIKVTFSDGSKKTATVVGTDSKKDLALIKVAGASGLKAASLGDSSKVTVGDQVVAIGSPEGLTGTVTSGIVSALDRDVTVSTDQGQGQGQDGQGPGGGGQWPFEFGGGRYNGDVGSSTTTYKAIQTDASLNPGNSGGALINMSGQVIGINSAMYSAASGQNSSSAGSVGLGFSIPVNTVKSDLASLRSGGSDSNT